jgi:hypothetical protein
MGNALRAWAYAIALGDAGGGRVIAGDISGRHDFGLAVQDHDRRIRQPWAEPEQVIQPSVPWHIEGSLLGLELGLAHTMLRRVSADVLSQPPRLLSADREVFARTVSLLPVEQDDHDAVSIVDAIGVGRQRVAQLGAGPGNLDEVADEIGMDGWRRRALRWTLMNDPASASSYFSLADFLRLGRQTIRKESHDEWGTAAAGLDGCLCTEFPVPGRWTILVGRSRGGQVASQVADLNLRILLALKELQLSARMARGVLAAATQDYIDTVSPLYGDDWLTLVRSAQTISTERIADYVAALTADGTLSPVTPSPRAR